MNSVYRDQQEPEEPLNLGSRGNSITSNCSSRQLQSSNSGSQIYGQQSNQSLTTERRRTGSASRLSEMTVEEKVSFNY